MATLQCSLDLRARAEFAEGADAFARGMPPWSCPYAWCNVAYRDSARWQREDRARFELWIRGYGVNGTLQRSFMLPSGRGKLGLTVPHGLCALMPLRLEGTRNSQRQCW